MTGLSGKIIWLLLWALHCCKALRLHINIYTYANSMELTDAAAESCDLSISIRSAADAEEIRKRCSTIGGDLQIIDLMESINLDGVQTINGSFNVYTSDTTAPPPSSPFTISSSTLSTLGGSLYLDGPKGLEAVRLPALEIVQSLSIYGPDLTYMDITNLHTLGRLVLDAPSLKTLRHNGFREIIGGYRKPTFLVYGAALDSVDSLFENPLKGVGYTRFGSLPNVDHVNFGFASVESVNFMGNGNLTVTMGGPRTTSMEIDRLMLEGGVKELARSPDLVNLTVKDFKLADDGEVNDNPINNGKHILLPFDSLRYLFVSVYSSSATQRVELPREAVGWKDFELFMYSNSSRLDMSSQYSIDENGETKQTWYWPEGDIEKIYVNGYLKTEFLYVSLSQQSAPNFC